MTLRGIVLLVYMRSRVLFLVVYEMFQRFNFYGFQTVMFLFLKHELDLQLHNAIGLYHVFVGLGCLVPLVGTIIADLYMNKVLSIILISLYALIGNILIVLVSASFGEFGITVHHILVTLIFGLLFRAVGGGGIREIVRSLGNDQFKLPAEAKQLFHFHQLIYYSMTFGTIMAILVTPALRMHVSCFGQIYCFPAAFGVPALFMVLATVVMMSSYSTFKKPHPGRTVIIEFILCIKAAVKNFRGGGKHWMDNASHAYKIPFLDDVKATVRVLWLFLPLPIFWALLELCGSLWVYQATNMLGTVSKKNNWYVEPDQMQVIIPIVTLILMPILEHFLYPTLDKCKYFLSTPRQRMIFGSFLAVMAFVCAGYVQLKNEATFAITPKSGEGEIAILNIFVACRIQVTSDLDKFAAPEIPPMALSFFHHLPVRGTKKFSFRITNPFPNCGDLFIYDATSYLLERKTLVIMNTYLFVNVTTGGHLHLEPKYRFPDDVMFNKIDRCDLQLPRLGIAYSTRFLSTGLPVESIDFRYPPSVDVVFTRVDVDKGLKSLENITKFLDPNHHSIEFFHVHSQRYSVRTAVPTMKDDILSITLGRGEVGVVIVKFANNMLFTYSTVQTPITLSMWWQVPQYVLMAVAEFLFPVTLLEYSHFQVSERMRPVLTSFWLLSIALGNFLVSAVTFSNLFEREFWYYVLFGGLMAVGFVMVLPLFANFTPPEDNEQEGERGSEERVQEGERESEERVQEGERSSEERVQKDGREEKKRKGYF